MSIPRRRDVSEAELQEAGQRLLDAAYDFWKLSHEAGFGGAITWLDDSAGKTVLFTRGEYRSTLLHNVDQLRFEGAKLYSFNLESNRENGVDRAEDRSLMDDREKEG